MHLVAELRERTCGLGPIRISAEGGGTAATEMLSERACGLHKAIGRFPIERRSHEHVCEHELPEFGFLIVK
jgi:hypothetical protein